MRKLIAFSLLFAALFLSNFVMANSQVFSKAVFEEVKIQYLGKRWLMILWSVDCPACIKELALIQKLKATNPDLDIVLINADDNDEVDKERQKFIASYKLSALPNLYFPDGEGDHARFLIDKNWYGELPRSYFVDVNGKFNGKSGLISKDLIKKWLVNE